MTNKPIISKFPAIPTVDIQSYERYLPNAFDESLSILQKMNKVINQLNQVGLITNELVGQWNNLMEWIVGNGLTDIVSIEIDKRIENGTFDELIYRIVGDLTTLETTSKESLVVAVNEIFNVVESNTKNIGVLEDLKTINKENIVNAINEIKTTNDINNQAIISIAESTGFGVISGFKVRQQNVLSMAVEIGDYITPNIVHMPNGVRYTLDSKAIPISNSNATLNRIDIIYIDVNGEIICEKGQDAINPVPLEHPENSVLLAHVIVSKGDTTINNVDIIDKRPLKSLNDLKTKSKDNFVLSLNELYDGYVNALQLIGNLSTLDTSAKDNLVNAINEVISNTYQQLEDLELKVNTEIGDLSTLNTTTKDNLVNAINEVISNTYQQLEDLELKVNTEIGDLSTLDTTAKDNLVNAINEVISNTYQQLEDLELKVNTEIGDLSTLDTTAKDNLVNAVNELHGEIDRFNGMFVDVKSLGALGDNLSNDSSFIQTALSTSKSIVYFPKGNYKISTNIIVPENITLWFAKDAKLVIDIDRTVEINGFVKNEGHQIFDGEGKITGRMRVDTVYAEWFGVRYTNAEIESTIEETTKQFQNAITYCQKSELSLTLPKNAKILITNQLVIEHGRNSNTEQRKELQLFGNNAIIYTRVDDYAIFIKPLCQTENMSLGHATANVDIYDLTFDNYFGKVSNFLKSGAIKIGRSGYSFNGFKQSRYERILMQGYTNKPSIEIESARMLKFENLHSRDGSGVFIKCVTLNEFTGDMEFESCEFSGNVNNRPIELFAYNTESYPRPEIRGLRFDNCVIYGGGTRINASNHCLVADIWFENTAWDVGAEGENAVELFANGDAELSKIVFDNPYITNYTGHALRVETQGNSKINDFQFNGALINWITAPSDKGSIYLLGVENALIQNSTFSSVSGNSAIHVEECEIVSIQNNKINNSDITNMMSIGKSNNYIITGNIGANAINEWMNGTNKIVDNNLSIVVGS